MSRPHTPPTSPLEAHFQHEPGLVFLNHGSFGATPAAVHDHQREFHRRIERDPIRFYIEELWDEMDASRRAVAALVGVEWDELAMVSNATQAVATVLHNLQPMLQAGDELLANSHEYPACMNNLRMTAARTGAVVVTPQIPFPARSEDEVADAILSRVTARTKIALISHLTSPSGIVLPVRRLCRELEGRGVRTIVDGAHGVGCIPLNIPEIGCSYYTSNCHKWLCAPKGSAFLWVRKDRQSAPPGGFRPVILSNFAEKPKPGRAQFLTEFDYVGTSDPTPILTLPFAIRHVGGLVPGGWPSIIARNRELAVAARRHICSVLGVEPPAPESMLGPLATIILPAHGQETAARLAQRPSKYHDALQDRLLSRWRIQVPVWSAPPGSSTRVVRISAQIYNTMEQFEYLANALKEELAAERASAGAS